MVDMGRYERLAALPEIGAEGVKRLRTSSVAVIGVGGLGCTAASALAAGGVGRLTLVDPGIVNESNLDRQILYTPADIGRRKVDAAFKVLSAQNPDASVREFPSPFEESMLDGMGVCVVAVDDVAVRMEVMRAAVAKSVPCVIGCVERFSGTVQTWVPGEACCGCVSNEDSGEPAGRTPAVFGPTPQVFGTIQASEALLICAGLEPAFAGRVFAIDLRHGSSRVQQVRRRDDCPVCGDN